MTEEERRINLINEKIIQNESENKAYRKQLERFYNRSMPVHEVINVCSTPYILKILGSKAKKIVINQKELENAIITNSRKSSHTNGHGISAEATYKLPDAIRSPVMVLKGNLKNSNSVIVVTELKDTQGNLIWVPTSLDRQNGKISNIASIYGKKNLSEYIRRNPTCVLAINTKKADALADIEAQCFKSICDTVTCFDNSIAYTMENVKYPDENSQTEEIRMEQDKKFEIVIDTETTGFSASEGDELLQVSIIDTDGNVLYDKYVRPTKNSSWEAAQAVNGISPEMVADCPTIEEQKTEIQSIISRASKIIGYNTSFDLAFLRAAGIKPSESCERYDVMREFADRCGTKWFKLIDCANHYGYDWNSHPESAHNSLGDCFATLHCYKGLQAELQRTNKYTYIVEQTIKTVVTVEDEVDVFAEQQVWDMIDADAVYFEPQSPSYTVEFRKQSLARTDKPRLFIDMDGTIARFHDEVRYLERMWEEDFFTELKPFQEFVDGIRIFKQEHPDAEVFILSAAIAGEPPYCKQQKHKWLDRYLPEIDRAHRIFTEVGKPKAGYLEGGISRTDILIDDYNKGLEEWEQSGGRAVKCINNINHKGLHGKLWEGETIRNIDPPREIAARLAEIYYGSPTGKVLKRELTPEAKQEQEQSDKKGRGR